MESLGTAPTEDLKEALVQLRDILNKQEVPEPHYVIFPDETICNLERIIYTDTVNIEDCKMTERTVDQVNKEIRDQEKRIEARSFIIGPKYRKAIVSFGVKADAGDLNDADFEVWNEKMDDYFDGNRPGMIYLTIESTGCENEITLDEELLEKLDEVKHEIEFDEQINIMRLKQERKRLRDIEDKKMQLEWATKRNEMAAQRLSNTTTAFFV